MNKLIVAGVAGAFLAGSAAMAANEPVKLTDGQMDDVTAGFRLLAGLGLTGGAAVATFGGGTASTTENTVGATLSDDSVRVTDTGGVTISSLNATEGAAQTTTNYASAAGGVAVSGGTLGVGAMLFIP